MNKERLTVTIKEHKPILIGVFIGLLELVVLSYLLYASIKQNNTVIGILSTVCLIAVLYLLNKVYFFYEDKVLEVKRART